METSHIEKFKLPEKVTAKVDKGILTIKGEKGEVSKSFLHPRVELIINNNIIEFNTQRVLKVEKKLVQTFLAHVKNLCKGVTKGHEYKLKICSGHFPMNVSLKGKTLEIKNFIGEAVPRKIEIKDGVDVKLDGTSIVVTGIDKELVSQTAASFEKLTRRNGFDKRRFQDGIYIIEKDGKKIE
ncbi:MAG: 50S ribosomal protein L6 [Candidatus Woesearchaeota archaeon]